MVRGEKRGDFSPEPGPVKFFVKSSSRWVPSHAGPEISDFGNNDKPRIGDSPDANAAWLDHVIREVVQGPMAIVACGHAAGYVLCHFAEREHPAHGPGGTDLAWTVANDDERQAPRLDEERARGSRQPHRRAGVVQPKHERAGGGDGTCKTLWRPRRCKKCLIPSGNFAKSGPGWPDIQAEKSEGSKRHHVLQWAEKVGQKKLGTWSHGATWASAAPFKTKAAGQIRRAERTARRQARARGRDPGQLFVRRFVGLLLEAAA